MTQDRTPPTFSPDDAFAEDDREHLADIGDAAIAVFTPDELAELREAGERVRRQTPDADAPEPQS